MGKKTVLVAILTMCLLLAMTSYALAAGFNDMQGQGTETQINKLGETKKMPPPKNLTADVNNDAGSVTLKWKAAPKGGHNDKVTVSYAVYRNDTQVASDIDSTTYTDEGLQAGEYTYYVKAYREVVAGNSGKIIRFESAPSKSVTVEVNPVTVNLPRIIKFAGIVVPEDVNTIEVPLANINISNSIVVSKDCKLAVNVEDLGFIGQLSLVAGKENNIHNILIPRAEEIDVSEIDLNKLCQALSQCPPSTQEEILKSVNFTGLFEALKGKPGIKNSIINETDLGELLETVTTDNNIDKGDILDAVDIAAVINVVRNDGNITQDDILRTVQFSQLLNIVSEIEDEAVRNEILNAVNISDLLASQTKEDVFNAVDFKALFEGINKTSESTKDAIVQAINFTALFDVVKKANSATTEAVFNAVNFTALFCAMTDAGAGDETIAKMIDVTVQIIGIMQHNITRSDILAIIKFDELNIESLFNWLSRIDGNPDVLAVEATLTDNAANENTYTININK